MSQKKSNPRKERKKQREKQAQEVSQALVPVRFKFMQWRMIATVFSVLFLLASVGVIAMKGFNFGVDFTGGSVVEVSYPQGAEVDKVRSTLEAAGFENAQVQFFGTSTEVLIRIPPKKGTEGASQASLGDKVIETLQAADSSVEKRRIEFVGPSVGDELTNQGGLAILYALIGILAYVAFRFSAKFAIGPVAALAHDVLITLGILSLLQVDFDLSVLAAVLAVIGYSLNDTIVVYDRIRENFRKVRIDDNVHLIDMSLNQTLARTMVTSLTTLIVLFALFFLGGEVIHGFATALIIGVLVGTYSSIYVASNILIWLDVDKTDLLPPKTEQELIEEQGIVEIPEEFMTRKAP